MGAVLLLPLLVVSSTPRANTFANSNEQRIAELNSQVAENNKKIVELQQQGDTLSNKLESISLEANNLQIEIDANEAKNNKLKNEIAEAERKIVENKRILASSIKKLYIDGDISSLEILASSKNLSDYVDKQEYRDRVKNKVASLTTQVQSLKVEMEKQQNEVAGLLRDQITLRVDLKSKQEAQEKLIAETRGDENEYQRQNQANNAEIARLRAEQTRATSSSIIAAGGWTSGTGNGGYPTAWANAPYPCWGGAYYYGGTYQRCADDWGMFKRECVSYAAFKVAQSGRDMPYWGGRGDANKWPANARAERSASYPNGIPVDGIPRVGDVAISMSGRWGHAMYVERVNSDGTITISQYNFPQSGQYSTGNIRVQGSGLQFIHF